MHDDVNARQYDKDHSWQYDIRLRNREADLRDAGLTDADVAICTSRIFDLPR